MRSIQIKTDVFSIIWSLRIEGEESEDEILRRVLTNRQPIDQAVSTTERKQEEVDMFGKVRWVDDIVAVLRNLGGSAPLSDIYDEVRSRRKVAGRSITREYQATIRRTLEDHSSDSANHRAEDLFRLLERGVWALR